MRCEYRQWKPQNWSFLKSLLSLNVKNCYVCFQILAICYLEEHIARIFLCSQCHIFSCFGHQDCFSWEFMRLKRKVLVVCSVLGVNLCDSSNWTTQAADFVVYVDLFPGNHRIDVSVSSRAHISWNRWKLW